MLVCKQYKETRKYLRFKLLISFEDHFKETEQNPIIEDISLQATDSTIGLHFFPDFFWDINFYLFCLIRK